MPSFEEIYAQYGEDYDALVTREDYEGNILRALADIQPLDNADVVELGAGSGRLTRLLAPVVRSIRAYDASEHMLSVADKTLRQTGATNWTLGVSDNRGLPVEDASADISLAGWTFGHSVAWYPARWRAEIGRMIDEMQRVLRPGGTAIILETMTTGSETPRPPTEWLAAYYAWLEKERGYSSTTIRTDYQFESLDEAERLTRFFFGDELADTVVREKWVVLPECTGIWWRTLKG
jgi:ubiquinone/menaquinone biosynthesis C-methylase UbiE